MNPIEFKALEVVKEDPKRGLEKFFKVIDYIRSYYKSLNLAFTVVNIPYMNAFSRYPDGYRRTCAIVKVSRKGRIPCYIIEVGRPDNWSVSTLFIWPVTNNLNDIFIEKVIYRLLQKLSENNGHWDSDFLSQQLNFKSEIGKHIHGQSVTRWAERIVEKII